MKLPVKKAKAFLHSAILAFSFNAAAAPAQELPSDGKRADRYAAIVIDGATGKTLYSRDEDQRLHPASTTKVMTAYLTFEALKKGELTMEQRLPVSYHAATRERTNLAMTRRTKTTRTVTLEDGRKVKRTSTTTRQTVKSITVKDALLGLITHSANDAAVVLAEGIAGSEAAFARKMNAKAAELGMANTTFVTPNGLPHARQRSTVADMAKLSRAIINDFPEYYPLFATQTFTYNGVTYKNFNPLLGAYEGADGIKTGWVSASGHNLTASARRGDTRVIAVVFGAASSGQRLSDIKALLDYGFAKLQNPATTYAPPATPAQTPAQTPAAGENTEENEGFGTQEEKPADTDAPAGARVPSEIGVRVRLTPPKP